MLSFEIIIGFIILCSALYFLFLNMYFKSKAFISIKRKIDRYTKDCNALNKHIEDLKSTYEVIKVSNYGEGTLSDNSVYNMKRSHWKKELKSQFVHKCSSSIVKNASNQPFKYICKYFNVQPNEETLEKFEMVLNNFAA